VTGRLAVLSTSHRVAPGLLTSAAWDVLRAADRVFAATADHPQRAPLEAAGVAVEILAEPALPAAPASPTLPAAPASPTVLARRLVDLAAAGTFVVWLGGADGDPGLGAALAGELARLAEQGEPPELEVVPASYDVPGARLLDLVVVMDRLRSPGGCPWDREQTHESLVKYLLEEAYETVEVIESGDRDALREELGDLLLQVVFHARIAEEDPDRPWSVDDVAGGIVAKLVHRHPHVFGDVDAPTAAHVEANWDTLKAAEKGRSSVVEGVPMAQPALALAGKLMSRAEKAGLDVPVPEPALAAPIGDEVALGDLLLGVVALARRSGLDAEAALRAAARRYRDRVTAAEG
jgi:XTP/dITP diphosphohydrolase